MPHRPVTRFDYDEMNRRTQTRACVNELDSSGVPIEKTSYDWLGRAWLQVDSDNHAKAFVYGLSGQLEWVVTDVKHDLAELPTGSPNNWTTGQNGPRLLDSTATQYKYNELGQQTSQIDARGHETSFAYDSLGRRTARYLPAHNGTVGVERWHYDWDLSASQQSAGSKRPNAVRHIDFNTRQTFVIQDASGRVREKQSALGPLVQFEYTASGQRTLMRDNLDRTARETRYVYDQQNRLRIKAAPEGTLTYVYNPAGQLQVISSRTNYPALASAAPSYDFASIHASAVLANPDGASMTIYYDARGRLTKVNTDGTGAADVAYSYNSVGSQGKMRYRNAIETAYDYNTRNQLRWLRSSHAATPGTTLASFDYDDADPGDGGLVWPSDRKLAVSGQRRGMRENIQGAVRLVGYTYDNLNRLTRESLHSSNDWTVENGYAQYDSAPGYADEGYDPVGNRRQRTASNFATLAETTSYASYNANDWLGSLDGTKVAARFDENGNTLQFNLDGDSAYDQAVEDKYDHENRLIEAVRPVGTVTLIYDGDGHRVQKQVGSLVTKYIVEDRNLTGYAQVVEERDGADSTRVAYVYGLDLVSQKRGAQTSYYGYDGLGTVRYLTDSTAAITDTYTYDAFGILIAQNVRNGAAFEPVTPLNSHLSTVNHYHYTGEQWDEDLGMYYLRARYYSPNIGGFWSADSFEGIPYEPATLHRYLYCRGNPVNMTDPSGYDGTGTLPGTLVVGGGMSTFAGLQLPAISGATAAAWAKIGVIAGTVAITLSGDRATNRNVPYLMRLQYQEGSNRHYWSMPIPGKQIPGSIPPRYEPVTKRQVQEQLGIMFMAFKTQDYVQEDGWKPYSMGSDEPRLWSAIIKMSLFVQTHGPTEAKFYTFHQEYLNPLDTTSPRIDLENILGANLVR